MKFAMRAKAMTVFAASALLVGACGGGDDSDTGTPEASAETTTSDGTTAPGTMLQLGQPARVEFAPNAPNPEPTSQIDVTVTSIRAGSTKDLAQFRLPDRAQNAGVYYVKADVENVGDANLAGTWLVLYGKVSDVLVVRPVTFGSTFAKCNYQPFGKKFTTGATAKVCMVMLAPDKGTISEVQWRGPDNAEPISWPAS